MTAELIGALSAAAVAILSALAAVAASRNTRALKRAKDLSRQNRTLRIQFEAALGYIYRLRRMLISSGRRPPRPPDVLELDEVLQHDEEGENADERTS